MRNGSGGEIGGSGGGSGGVGKNNEGGAGSSVGNRWRPAVFSNLPVVPGVVGSDEDLPVKHWELYCLGAGKCLSQSVTNL